MNYFLCRYNLLCLNTESEDHLRLRVQMYNYSRDRRVQFRVPIFTNDRDLLNYILLVSMDDDAPQPPVQSQVTTPSRKDKSREKRRTKRRAKRQKEIEQLNQKRTEEENRRKTVCNFLTDDVYCKYLRVQDDTIDVNRDLIYRKVAHSYRELHPYKKKKNPNAKCKGQCSICLESIHGDLQCLPCKHMFHQGCISKLIKRECPLCRQLF